MLNDKTQYLIRNVHKEQVKKVLLDQGFRLNEFAIEQIKDGNVPAIQIIHKQTELKFVFRRAGQSLDNFSRSYTLYKPGLPYYRGVRFDEMKLGLGNLESWLISHVRPFASELSGPDPFAELLGSNFSSTPIIENPYEYFPDEVRTEINEKFEELKNELIEELNLSDGHQMEILGILDHVAAQLESNRRLDWLGILMSNLAGIFLNLAFNETVGPNTLANLKLIFSNFVLKVFPGATFIGQ